jgi:DNA-binding NarL/FixJ family response regulator
VGWRWALNRKVPNLLVAVGRSGSEPGEAPGLNRRQLEVLRLIAEGVHTPAIAKELGVSVGTVEVHRRSIMRKLGLHTVAELTRYAIREGLIAP